MLLVRSMSVFKMMFVLFIFCIAYVNCADRKCDPIDKLQCDDGSCVSKFVWCDTKEDCTDGSDEMYCNGIKPCRQELHFECENKKCVPVSARCDEFDDCYDGSDEKNCNSSIWLEDVSSLTFAPTSLYSSSRNFNSDMPADASVHKTAVDRAVEYLLSMRTSDYDWGSFTPRAAITLSMASNVSPIAKKNKELILKQLNIQLLKDLMQERKPTLSRLALYINALHGTCQDPRNFHGTNLVARLRSETDSAIKNNTSIPLAFLTLCLSNSTRYDDNYKLAELYNSRKIRSQTGSRALIILTMACIMNKDKTEIFGKYMSDFFTNDINRARIADIYTQALFKQASIAAGFTYPYDLQSAQLPDGSFGDVLSTYYAIPVLLNSSLLDIVCKSPNKRSVSESDLYKTEGRNEVSYSLWMTSGKDSISHSTTVKFYGKKSLFDIMTVAASRDPLYKFLYEESEQEGKMVYSLAGIPNDVEKGTFWSLYFANTDVKVNSAQGLNLLDNGVDKYFADDKDHFIFWLRRTLPTN